jgi:hypothetical protein
MTTTAPAKETSRTVSVQDMRVYPVGQQAAGVGAPVATLGNVVATWCLAGSSPSQQLNLTINGFALTTDTPSTVLVQPRQSDNHDYGFADEFAVQIITTSRNQMVVRIRRLDGNSGWGQDLRLDIFIVDDVANP